MLNPIHLRTLQECVRTGSFAEAARELGYTASAVSQQIYLLERALGAPLFERSARSVRATAVAELLAVRSREALTALTTLEREARALVLGDEGTLRLASFSTANARIVPTALAGVVARRPGAEVQLDEGDPDEVLASVLDGGVDAAIVFDYDLDPKDWPVDLERVELLAEPFLLAVSPDHPLADRTEIDLAELRAETWICTRADTAGARSLNRLTAEAGFTPRIVFRSNDYSVIADLVARNLGIAMLPGMAIPTSGVRTVHPAGRQSHRHVLVLYRPGNTNPLLPLALDCLADACTDLATSW